MPFIRTCKHCGRSNRVPAKYLASTGRCGVCKSPLPPVAEPLAADDIVVASALPPDDTVNVPPESNVAALSTPPPETVAVPLVGETPMILNVPPEVRTTSLTSGLKVLVVFSAIE